MSLSNKFLRSEQSSGLYRPDLNVVLPLCVTCFKFTLHFWATHYHHPWQDFSWTPVTSQQQLLRRSAFLSAFLQKGSQLDEDEMTSVCVCACVTAILQCHFLMPDLKWVSESDRHLISLTVLLMCVAEKNASKQSLSWLASSGRVQDETVHESCIHCVIADVYIIVNLNSSNATFWTCRGAVWK